MKKIRPVLLGTIGLLFVLVLTVGCYQKAAPDVTPTSAGGVEAVETEEGTPDMAATAAANSTIAAQTPEGGEETPTQEPTEPTPTTPTSPPVTPTSVPATPAPTEPAPAPPTGPTTHVVQPGENLFRIALRYGMTVETLAQANNIANPRLIHVGQKLTIPSVSDQPSQPAAGGTTYVVQPGENLFRIALRYNMSYLYLAQYNGIANPSNIYAGQVLRIPPH